MYPHYTCYTGALSRPKNFTHIIITTDGQDGYAKIRPGLHCRGDGAHALTILVITIIYIHLFSVCYLAPSCIQLPSNCAHSFDKSQPAS